MANIRVIEEKCTGCALCLAACPFGAIILEERKAKITDDCNLCAACIEACESTAIELVEGLGKGKTAVECRGIWVFAEQSGGKIKNVAFELLGQSRKLADTLQTEVCTVLLGDRIAQSAKDLAAYGAEKVYLVEHPGLAQFNDESYADVLSQLVKTFKPEIFLIGATANGRSLGPRVASRLNTGLTADCTELDIDDDTGMLLQTRPTFGGNLMATIICPRHRPQMATVRPKVMRTLEPDYRREATVVRPDVVLRPETKTKTLGLVKALKDTGKLAGAEVIVAAGKGLGDPKNLGLVEELAGLLGAAIGASRAIVDEGWIGYEHQVGQTGKTVAPKLYIACGISGAVQHLAGMSSADVIAAINNDPKAPIFKIADYTIVGDCLEVLPALIEELIETKG